jgi:hypothetical protein
MPPTRCDMDSVSPAVAAQAVIEAAGIPTFRGEPLVFRLLWSLGLKVPPPHFAGVGINLAVIGTLWALLWTIPGLFVGGWTLVPDVFMWALAGLGIGAIQVAYIEQEARRCEIPLWEDLDANPVAASRA